MRLAEKKGKINEKESVRGFEVNYRDNSSKT